MYAMADNNLDGAIAADVAELISNTDAIAKPDFYPLIFIDRGYQSAETIPGLKAKNGIDASDYHSGVRYIAKNFQTNAIQVIEEYGELNSDNQQVMTDFLTWAFKRCKAKDANAEVLFTLGSHGSGWQGFGGDENKSLLQVALAPNNKIKTAIKDSIKAVGDPNFTQLDLLGFDACLMMSYSAQYVYNDITKYYMASEALEPGHGWTYSKIDYTKSVKDVAVQFADDFAASGSSQSTKTLAVFDQAAFDEFKQVMDDFAVKLTTWLEGDKASRKPLVEQAWTSTLTVPSVSSSHKDLGVFLAKMASCAATNQDSSLSAAIAAASGKYSEMLAKGHFAYRAPGTGLTGMHIYFPFDKPNTYGYDNWMVGGDGFAKAGDRAWNQFLDSLHKVEITKCTGRDSYVNPYDKKSTCAAFAKGVVTGGYEYYHYCVADKALPHCSECEKCKD
jgi:hypothetical protein